LGADPRRRHVRLVSHLETMSGRLHISGDLWLPTDAVTQTFAVYGGKGMGKSNFAAVLCEELYRLGLRFSVIDPMGVFWGLKHSGDGKGKGIEVLILGGRHGDLAVDPSAGAAVADLIVDEKISVIVDISRRPDGKMWSVGERIRFVTDYFRRLYERQGEKSRPLIQILDEAGRFVPQMIPHGSPQIAACVGAIETAVEEGRNVGLGVCLVTQRSARMNKSVSELAECMIAFRTVGPRSIGAIIDWFGEHVAKERQHELIEKLRKLPVGEALIVSPGWLDFEGVAKIRMRETFDSSATPKAGKQRRASGKGTTIDLERFRTKMAEIAARVRDDDPKTLRARIAELLRERDSKKSWPLYKPPEVVRKIEPAIRKRELRILGKHVKFIREQTDRLDKIRDRLAQSQQVVVSTLDVFRARLSGHGETGRRPLVERPEPKVTRTDRRTGSSPVAQIIPDPRKVGFPPMVRMDGEQKITPAMMRMLEALAYKHPEPLTRTRLAASAALTESGGTFTTYYPRLRSMGLIVENSGRTALTEAGFELVKDKIGQHESPEQIRERWRNHRKMTPLMWRLVEAAMAEFPNGLSREGLAERSKIEVSGGTFTTYFPRLKRMGLLIEENGLVTAAPELIQ